jgi:hypothetical protein
MNKETIEKHFSSQIESLDLDTISKINEVRNSVINKKTESKLLNFLPKYALATILPCFLVAGLYMNQINNSTNEIMIDLLLDETLTDAYVYETTAEEFTEILAVNSVYDFEF